MEHGILSLITEGSTTNYKEPYPIPRTDEAFDVLSKAKYLSTLDLTSGYYQILLREEDKNKTAFMTREGCWEYMVLPMGITNAVPTFQCNMEIMLSGLLWKYCLIYINDIIVFSNTFKEHLQHLKAVFNRMEAVNVVAKPAKCHFCKSEVHFLGHIVGNGTVKSDKVNVQKVRDARLPTTIKEIRAFCGLVGIN